MRKLLQNINKVLRFSSSYSLFIENPCMFQSRLRIVPTQLWIWVWQSLSERGVSHQVPGRSTCRGLSYFYVLTPEMGFGWLPLRRKFRGPLNHESTCNYGSQDFSNGTPKNPVSTWRSTPVHRRLYTSPVTIFDI